ncbi:MAG TPA: hypothetical protein VJJ22_03490 [Candidatus Paceibacterota bacterium]
MNLICLECKNDVDLVVCGELNVGKVIECDSCGITLLVTDVSSPNVKVEIADEGK